MFQIWEFMNLLLWHCHQRSFKPIRRLFPLLVTIPFMGEEGLIHKSSGAMSGLYLLIFKREKSFFGREKIYYSYHLGNNEQIIFSSLYDDIIEDYKLNNYNQIKSLKSNYNFNYAVITGTTIGCLYTVTMVLNANWGGIW